MATFTRDWNESAPAGTDQASSGDDEIKHLKVEISDRLKTLIYGLIAGENDGNPGCKNLIFKQQAAAPGTPNADEIALYALDDGTNCGLYAKQEDGYIKQILKKIGSDILLDMSDQVDDSTIEVHTDGTIRAKDDGITFAKLGCEVDEDNMASDSAALVPTQQSVKAYVDNRVAGETVQVVNTQTGAVATGSTQMPHDNTIPQKTEGDEYMTLAITPKATTNKLKIDVVFIGNNGGTSVSLNVALFQDTTASALAAAAQRVVAGNAVEIVKFTHYMDAGTTSETTFKVRCGGNAAGTTTFNGYASGRIFGGVCASSITITEIKV